jgi:hypothetical protein
MHVWAAFSSDPTPFCWELRHSCVCLLILRLHCNSAHLLESLLILRATSSVMMRHSVRVLGRYHPVYPKSSNSRFQKYNGRPDYSPSPKVLNMELKFFFLLIFASNTLGQALLSVLAKHLELSTFNYYVNASTNLTNLLSSANNFTLLAPSNTAFEQWFSGQGNPSLSDDVIEATLFYHLLHGGFPTASFTDESQFVASHLTNATYSNVTGGQRVELVTGTGGQQQLISDNKTVTGIVSPVSAMPKNS